MEKLGLYMPEDRGSGPPFVWVKDVDGAGYRRLPGQHAALGEKAFRQLLDVLGKNFGDSVFDLQCGSETLRGCRVVQAGGPGGGCRVLYLLAEPTP